MPATSPNHEPATLRTPPPPFLPSAARPPVVAASSPRRPVLLPLALVLPIMAVVGFGSAALTLVGAYFLFGQNQAVAQSVPAPVVEVKPVTVETPRPESEKAKPALPPPDTLAVLPFELLFEPTPAFRHQVEKLNATLPQLLTDEGKLRVKPLAQTAPLRYCRNPIDAARELNVRAVLVVKFTNEPGQKLSTCHLELIDVVSGFLLWGMEIEAPDGFLKHPECFDQIRQHILEQVPKRMLAPQ